MKIISWYLYDLTILQSFVNVSSSVTEEECNKITPCLIIVKSDWKTKNNRWIWLVVQRGRPQKHTQVFQLILVMAQSNKTMYHNKKPDINKTDGHKIQNFMEACQHNICVKKIKFPFSCNTFCFAYHIYFAGSCWDV